MAYSIPRYIAAAAIDVPELRYKWDDWRASEDFQYDSAWIVEKIAGAALRARITLGIGIYEWIIWRFRSVSDDPIPFHLAEAAWCANVRRDYMEYDEFDRDEWLGPIRGPLWCAMTWLIPMVLSGDEAPDEWESGISFLPRLAVHVLPDAAIFEEWLRRSVDRLLTMYPAAPEDPFEDLFSENEEERRGPLAPREVLDPDYDFRPELAARLTDQYLRNVDYASNEFLKSPRKLLDEGFPGTPYRFEAV